MSFKGLENVGSAFSKYGDLIAQGMKDKIDLEKELHQTQFKNSLAAQQAAKEYGYAANDPALRDALGISDLPVATYGSQGAAAPSTAAPQPSGGPAPASLPMTGAAGTPQSVAETPPPGQSMDQDQNINITSDYQKQLQNMPQSAQGGQQWASPYAAAQQSAVNEKMYQQEQEYKRAALINQGKTDRLGAVSQFKFKNAADKIAAQVYGQLSSQEKSLMNNPMIQSNPQAMAQLQQIRSQKAEIEQHLNGVYGSGSSSGSSAPAANNDDQLWQSYKAKHPQVVDNPSNRQKVLAALKGS